MRSRSTSSSFPSLLSLSSPPSSYLRSRVPMGGLHCQPIDRGARAPRLFFFFLFFFARKYCAHTCAPFTATRFCTVRVAESIDNVKVSTKPSRWSRVYSERAGMHNQWLLGKATECDQRTSGRGSGLFADGKMRLMVVRQHARVV